MTSIKTIIATVAVSIALSFSAQAEDAQILKPLQGVSFHAGTKHAVAYFLTDKSTCKLVLTLADDANYAPTRFEAAIEAGKSTPYQLAEGKSLDFACQADARAMKINTLETFAAHD
jgi:hypothetical protein